MEFLKNFWVIFFLFNLTFFYSNAFSKNPELVQICEKVLVGSKSIEFTKVLQVPGLKVYMPGILEIDFKKLLQMSKWGNISMIPHELVSAQRFAYWLKKNFNQELVLIPDIDNISIPGFDGIILNKNGETISYFSLKTLKTINLPEDHEKFLDPNRRHFSKAVKLAAENLKKVSDYHLLENWLTPLQISLINDPRARNWLQKVIQIFKIHREFPPSTILVDLDNKESHFPTTEEFFAISNRIARTQGKVKSVVFLMKKRVISVSAPVTISR